jgi:hypothetical protein
LENHGKYNPRAIGKTRKAAILTRQMSWGTELQRVAEEPVNQEVDAVSLESPTVLPFIRDAVSPQFLGKSGTSKDIPYRISFGTEPGKDLQGLDQPSEGMALEVPDNVLHETLAMHEVTFDGCPSAFKDDGQKSRCYSKANLGSMDDNRPISQLESVKVSSDENKIGSGPLKSKEASPEESFAMASIFQSR